jgi:hypothetical protein
MRLSLLCSLLLWNAAALPAEEFPKPKWVGETERMGKNIQRTMRLLAESTPEKRNTVRVLFYGQSITEQGWWKIVADDLRARFPHANLVIENRAIGGHSSQLLVKTAEADLYPFQPDLLIFHVYGAHDKYEEILRTVRERTCAEILQQNDHVLKDKALTEETDPSKLSLGKGNWDEFMNHNWLPSLSRKYQTELCDQREIWKRYLKDFGLEPKALLRDGVHLNKHGEFLMAEAVKAHLRYDPKLGPSPAEEWVTTVPVPADGAVEFTGVRVDAILSGSTAPCTVTVDGSKPSAIPDCHGFTRTSSYPKTKWPCILRVRNQQPLVEEEWILTMRNTGGELATIEFDVAGSVTGPDGIGNVGERFVSNSKRVVIEPDDWNLASCVQVFGRRLTDGFTVKWKSEFRGVDEFSGRQTLRGGDEQTQTLVQGLTNGRHRLALAGNLQAATGLRIYRPPLPVSTRAKRDASR